MDALTGLGITLVLAYLVVPLVALGLSMNARRRLRELETENEQRKAELRYLYDRLEAEKKARAATAAPARHPAEAAAEAAAARTAAHGGNAAAQAAAAAAAAIAAARALEEAAATAPSAPAALEAAPSSAEAAGVGGAAPAGAPEEAEPAASPEASPPHAATAGAGDGGDRPGDRRPPPRAPSTPSVPEVPLEQRLAAWFTRIGAGALLLGVLYFYKYAVDNEWIGPAGRVALGALVGLAILGLAERVRPTTKPAFVHALVGVGLAFLHVTAYASAAFYHLVEPPVAFGANAVLLLLGAALAWRHHGEAVLVLVLVAGFANPVMLSTGEDRPFALFAYLFALTAVTHYVSVRQRFRVSLWLAVVGVAVLGAGWYDKFFATFDHRGQPWTADRPPEELVGAYHALARRAVPLGFLALFTAEWLAAAFLTRSEDEAARPPTPSRSVPALAVAALVLSHVGAAALLHDRALLLGGVMVGLGLVAVAALRALDATRFLLVPMLAAFALLARLTGKHGDVERLLLLGLLGLWSAVYVLAFLKGVAEAHRRLPAREALLAAVALFAFGALATLILAPDGHFYVLGAVLAALGVTVVIIAGRGEVAWLGLAALALSFVPWLWAAERTARLGPPVDAPFLALAALWWGVYAASITRDALAGRERRWVALLTLALSGLAFLALALTATSAEASTLRALLTAGVGAVDLALATLLARGGPALRPWVHTLAALSLGLFAPAVAFGLSGATITVVWALLALVALFILAEAREPLWLGVAGTLLAVAILRALSVDVATVERALSAFEWTQGRRGMLEVRAFLNPRAYALLSTGVVSLIGARLLARGARRASAVDALPPRFLARATPVLATLGYAMLTVMLVVETRAALVHLPPPPSTPLDAEEFAVFMESVRSARQAHHNLLAMSTTLILALVAMTLLGVGFAARDPFHRYLGLTVFLGTLGKLVLWDVWNLPRLYQVVVLTVVGASLLGSGFLYARLKALFKGGAGLAALLLLLGGARAEAAEDPEAPRGPAVLAGRFQFVGVLSGIDEAGYFRLAIGTELYRHSVGEPLFADLRVADADDREVPYVIETAPPEPLTRTVTGQRLDPGATPDGGYRATFELPEGTRHCLVDLGLSPAGPYLRRTVVEVASAPNDFQVVAKGGLVYSVSFEGSDATSARLRYPESVARYVRITLLPDPQGPSVELAGAVFGCVEPEPLGPRERVPLTIVERRRDEEKKTTIIDLDAGAAGLPVDRLHLAVATPEYQRRVRVRSSAHKSAWPAVGGGVLYRVGDGGPEAATLEFGETRKRWLRLEIMDGDDAPLDVQGVEGSFPARRLVLRARRAGAHRLYVGDQGATAPSYDLARVAERRPGELAAKPAAMGALAPNPGFGKESAPSDLPWTERHREAIGVALTVAILGLALWALRLLRPPRT